jgi:hypothetical protein
LNWADAKTLGERLLTRRHGARATLRRLAVRLRARSSLPVSSSFQDLATFPALTSWRLPWSLRGFASARVGRNLLGITVLLGLATGFSSDRAPNGVVTSASALSLGERTRTPVLRPGVDPIAGAFAAFGMGTAEAPQLRSSLDDSFVMVAAAARGHENIFEGLRVVRLDEARTAVPAEADVVLAPDVDDDGLVADLLAGRPRMKPLAPAPRVQVASLAPDDATSPLLRRRSLDLDLANGPPRKYPLGSAPYLDLIAREAKANDVPLWVALGVIWVESKFNPKLRGSHGVIGMMQVMPSTARYLGYTGTNEQLFDPETNVVWGMKELGKGYRLAKGDLCMTVAKYTGGFMTSRVRPAAQRYCNEVRRITGMT